MAVNFEIVKHNFVGYFDPENCSVGKFKPWIRFLNEHSFIRHCITSNAPLKITPLRLICTTFVVSPDSRSFTFTVGDTPYLVEESIINYVLNLPSNDFVDPPFDTALTQFFTDINYQGALDLTKMSKKHLVPEWDCIFDTLAKVFSNTTKNNFNNIPSLIQRIGFAIVYNQRINIGKLLWDVIIKRLITVKRDHDAGCKVYCYYPRILTLIFNHLVSSEQQRQFRDDKFEVSGTTHKKFYTRLNTQRKFPNIPVVITPFMANFIDLPVIAAHVPEPQPEPQVDQPTHAGTSVATAEQVLPSIHETSFSRSISGAETQVVVREDQEVVEPQPLTQVLEPNSELNTIQTTQPLQKLPPRRGSSETESVPATLPPLKKRRLLLLEAPASPSISSQQDMDIDMANEQLLDSFSQQDESIEIRHRAMALCTESSTPLLLTMGENITLDDIQVTRKEEHLELGNVTVPTIVTVEEPSQASEGKFDSLLTEIESSSPLPDGTYLAPLRDSPLADLSGESGGQLDQSIPEAIQMSNPNDQIDLIEDRDLRTLIAPPLTSLEGARVIFYAGTSKGANLELVKSDVRQTRSETHARQESETPLREIQESETPLREIQESAHTDTNTESLMAQIELLKEQLKKSQAETELFKAQVIERSSSSTSINNQLAIIQDDLQNMKNTFLPKINSISQSQIQTVADIADLTASQSQIHDSQDQMQVNVSEIATISAKVDILQQDLNESAIFNEGRFRKIEKNQDHMNQGLRHLFNLIKNSHSPSAEQLQFFEGEGGDGDERGPGDGNAGGSATQKAVEDYPTRVGWSNCSCCHLFSNKRARQCQNALGRLSILHI